MNTHWNAFCDELSWFVGDSRRVNVGALVPPGSWSASPGFSNLFPSFTSLLLSAYRSDVSLDDRKYILYSWEGPDGVSSWLCCPPENPGPNLFPAHAILLTEFGGIKARAGEFGDQWLLNSDESLTADEAAHDATFIRDYDWAFEEVPGGLPIEPEAYYSISREANGNATLCHRSSGEVLMFAPDHSFTHLVPLEGCPEYTLYRINGARGFVDWVEVVARQWARAFA